MLRFLTAALLLLSYPVRAEGLRAHDIIGITTGMSVQEVEAKIVAYNPDMVIQRVETKPIDNYPTYIMLVVATLPAKDASQNPPDEISVRFSLHADGTVLSSAVSHLLFPLPEDQRVTFKSFMAKLIDKYGPISNMNHTDNNEMVWMFNNKGSQLLVSLASDANEYARCAQIISSISDTTTRAGLPEKPSTGCGDFLYARLYAPDTSHPDTLAGYYMAYANQTQYLHDLAGDSKSVKEAKESAKAKKAEEERRALEKNSGPKF